VPEIPRKPLKSESLSAFTALAHNIHELESCLERDSQLDFVSLGLRSNLREEDPSQVFDEAKEFIREFKQNINTFAKRHQNAAHEGADQVQEHTKSIISWLQKYVAELEQNINKSYAAFLKQESHPNYTRIVPEEEPDDDLSLPKPRPSPKVHKPDNLFIEPPGIEETPELRSPVIQQNFTVEQQQQLMEENRDLTAYFDSWDAQLRQVEGKLKELSHATQFIAENIELQDEAVDHILDAALEARENISKGNKNIAKSKSSSNDFRLFVLVLLTFLSFALLLLHWMN